MDQATVLELYALIQKRNLLEKEINSLRVSVCTSATLQLDHGDRNYAKFGGVISSEMIKNLIIDKFSEELSCVNTTLRNAGVCN